jgi:hypothetical protein
MEDVSICRCNECKRHSQNESQPLSGRLLNSEVSLIHVLVIVLLRSSWSGLTGRGLSVAPK